MRGVSISYGLMLHHFLLLSFSCIPTASLEDPIRISVTNQRPDSAVVLWEPPKALSACPGKLKKYIICYQHEQDREIRCECGVH